MRISRWFGNFRPYKIADLAKTKLKLFLFSLPPPPLSLSLSLSQYAREANAALTSRLISGVNVNDE